MPTLTRNNHPFRSSLFVWATLSISLLASQPSRLVCAAEVPAKVVSVVVDYGDGVQKHFTALDWRDGMTVLDAMRGAEKHARGIKCELRGSGETAFLFKIDDMKNEAGGGRGWMFRVNGKLADRSLGVFPLQAGDAVLWKFEKYR